MRKSAVLLSAPVVLTLLAVGLSCAVNPLVVTGETLKVTGEEFVTVGDLMNQAYASNLISTEKYSAWVNFGKRFQALYPLALQTWERARVVQDAAVEKKAAEIVGVLADELAGFYKDVMAVQRDGGFR